MRKTNGNCRHNCISFHTISTISSLGKASQIWLLLSSRWIRWDPDLATKTTNMVLLVMLVTSQFFLTSHAYSDFVPITVCEHFSPHHHSSHHIEGQPAGTSPYSIHVSNTSYLPGGVMSVIINGTKDFKGFLMQARSVGDARPVGTFQGNLYPNTTYLWCSGGEPKNTVAHIHAKGVSWSTLEFTWKAPESRVGNITFWATVVDNFTIFWNSLESTLITGPPAVPRPNVTLEKSFQVTKDGCGKNKGCYSKPADCTNSSDCEFLVTYHAEDDNITFEMSGRHGYVSVGFNDKREMDQTECIVCSTSESRAVEVRHYYLDYYQPIRTDLRGVSEIVHHSGAYEDGVITCRFSRKMSASSPTIVLRNLTENWFFIFAWSYVSSTGALKYHRQNASFSAERVNITKPIMIKDGREAIPAPKPDGELEMTKTGCKKTKSCYSEPSDCLSSGDCDYLVMFKPCGNGSDVEFELSARGDWAAVGFNTKRAMDGTDTIICSRASGGTVVIEHYNLIDYKNPVKTIPSPAGLNVSAGVYDGGVVRCRFSRKKTSSDMLNLDEEVFLVFARGQITGNVLIKHSHKSITAKKLDVCSLATQLETETKDLTLLRAHGVLMIVAWVGFASIALFVARYMKQSWGELFGLKAWFQVHRALMISCLMFTVIGFVLVFVYAGGWSEDAGAHGILGVIITVEVCVQPIMAYFRPAPSHNKRHIFNLAHRGLGLSAFILAVVNTFLGVALPHLTITDTGVFTMIVFCLGQIPVLVLEMFLLLREWNVVKHHSPAVTGDTEKEVEVVKLKFSAPNYTFVRTCVFAFLIALVTFVCLTLLILITMEKKKE